jgi:hypothetical protein
LVCPITSGVPRSSNTLTNTSEAPATKPGAASGKITRQNRRQPRQPRFSAASSIAPSMLRSATVRFIRMNGK